jgi:hypothetical protein
MNDETLSLIQESLDRFYQCHAIFQVLGVRLTGFTLPRQHSISHYPQQICLFGAPNGLCSSITKSKHIPVVKKTFRCSNCCKALGQILLRNQQQDKIAVAHCDFESRGMLRGKVLTDACARAGIPGMSSLTYSYEAGLNHNLDNPGNAAAHNADTGVPSDNVSNGGGDDGHGGQGGDDNDAQGTVSHIFLPSKHGMFCFPVLFHGLNYLCSIDRGYPTNSEALAIVFNQHDFHELIQCFLFDQVHLGDVNPPSSSDVALGECPPFNSAISVYHSMMAVFYSPSDPCGPRGMCCKSICLTPCWQKGPPCRDTVFVKCDAAIPGVCGLDVVRLLAVFSFVWGGKYYPCALVRWFVHTAEEVDAGMGMWVV